MSAVAEKAAEATAEVVEETIDGVVDVVEVFRTSPVALAAAGTVGLLAGAVGGYFLAQKLLSKKFEEQMEVEIAETRQFFANLNKVDDDGKPLSPKDVLISRHGEEAYEALEQYQGRVETPAESEEELEEPILEGEPHDDIVDEEHIAKMERELRRRRRQAGETMVEEETVKETINVFKDDTFDLEEEMKYRTEDKPYIITHDEYFAAEKNYDTQSLTYYEVDDTLTDEHDKPLENTDKQVGDDHLVRFGSGSKDPNIVYIRNDRLGIDYEIVRSKGSYLEEVLGMAEENPNELKHSDQRDRRRALRHGDG